MTDDLDLSDLLAEIRIHIVMLGWEDPPPRLLLWAERAVLAGGFDPEKLSIMLLHRSLSGQWWVLRSLLPSEALQPLLKHLREANHEAARNATINAEGRAELRDRQSTTEGSCNEQG